MTIIRPGLCFALAVLCAGAYSTIPVQVARSDSSLTTPAELNLNAISLGTKINAVSLGTKIKWGAQLLFYPEAIKPVKVLRAYERATICRGKQPDSSRDLGFAIVSPGLSGESLETGKLISGKGDKPLTLKNVCDLSNNQEFAYILILDGLQNEKGGELYWTDISSAPASHEALLSKVPKQTAQ
ncbi:MAG: hypothetical protein OXF11_01155 [Deltaproteobacteria bacterium]|nr:hypothetical protein [Deltaproteobacteria bacterium]